MYRLCTASALLQLLIGICLLPRNTEPPKSDEGYTDEDYAILSTALKAVPEVALLLDHTEKGKYVLAMPLKNRLSKKAEDFNRAIPKDAIDDFDLRNTSQVAVDGARLADHSRMFLLSHEESEMYDRDGLARLQQKYGTEITALTASRPGINHDHNRALLYLARSYIYPHRPFWGNGMFILLSKDGGGWTIVKTLMLGEV